MRVLAYTYEYEYLYLVDSQYSFKTWCEWVWVWHAMWRSTALVLTLTPRRCGVVELKVERWREESGEWRECMCSQMYLQVKYALNVSFCEATTRRRRRNLQWPSWSEERMENSPKLTVSLSQVSVWSVGWLGWGYMPTSAWCCSCCWWWTWINNGNTMATLQAWTNISRIRHFIV